MKITVLSENVAGQGFLAEHGLSYLIESGDTTILFDTGASDVFLQNAAKLNIDINEKVNTIVLSHGHWDHGNGLMHLKGKTLLTHPEAFKKRYHKNEKNNLGINQTESQLKERFKVITSREPYKLSDRLIFLGEISRSNNFESKQTTFVKENGEPDFITDDSGLVIIEDNQLILISGCAHSGVCNMLDHARKITGINKVRAIIGGTHLKHNGDIAEKTIHYLQKNMVQELFASHCTELSAMCAFHRAFGNKTLKTGDQLSI